MTQDEGEREREKCSCERGTLLENETSSREESNLLAQLVDITWCMHSYLIELFFFVCVDESVGDREEHFPGNDINLL